jgi:hypothetical protein
MFRSKVCVDWYLRGRFDGVELTLQSNEQWTNIPPRPSIYLEKHCLLTLSTSSTETTFDDDRRDNPLSR